MVVNHLVTVDEHIYERQRLKVVTTAEGRVREVPPGELPEPTENLLVYAAGEPQFLVRLATPVTSDEDVPDEVGLALRRVTQRMYYVMPDGREVPGEQGQVEWNVGPAVHDGAIVLYLDCDGTWSSRTMFDMMVGIFVEELTPLGVQAHITAAPRIPSPLPPEWMSSNERRRQ